MSEKPMTSKATPRINLALPPISVLAKIASELSVPEAIRLTMSNLNFLKQSEDIIDFQNRLRAEHVKPGKDSANRATFFQHPEYRKPRNLFDDQIGKAYIVNQVSQGNFNVLPEPERTYIQKLDAKNITDPYHRNILSFIASKQLSLMKLNTLTQLHKEILCDEVYREKIATGELTVEEAFSTPYQSETFLARIFSSSVKQGWSKTIKYSGIATGALPGLAVGILNFLFNISMLEPRQIWQHDNWLLTETFYVLYKAPGIIIGAILGVFIGLANATANLITRKASDTNARDINNGLQKLHALPEEDFDQVISEIISRYKQNKLGTLKQSNRSNKLLKTLKRDPIGTSGITRKEYHLESIQIYMLGREGNQGKQLYHTIAQILKHLARPQPEEQLTMVPPR